MQQNRHAIRYWVFALLLSLFSGFSAAANADDTVFQAGIENLLAKSFNTKIQGAKQIADSGDERAEQILKALLDRQLFSVKSDNTLVFFDEDTDPKQAKQVLSGEMLAISDDGELWALYEVWIV